MTRTEKMSGNWERGVRRVVPYTPGEQPSGDVIKLNTNENPYPPSPKVKAAVDAVSDGRLRLYPDTVCRELTAELAAQAGVEPEQVFIGVGSDDVLSMAFLTFFNTDEPVLFPNVTYSFYDVWAKVYGIKYKTVALDKEFRIHTQDYFEKNGGIVIANPNAPTGILLGLEEIESIVAANPDSVVIIDEAYIDFGGKSAVGLTARYENLLVVQTFSKSRSLAGLRIGMAYGDKKLIKYLSDVRFSVNSYTMNTLSQVGGLAALRDREYFEKTRAEIIRVREYSKAKLEELGFSLTDSAANFLFAKPSGKTAGELFSALKARGIYVRWWDKPEISDRLRITVGTKEQMDALFAALKELL